MSLQNKTLGEVVESTIEQGGPVSAEFTYIDIGSIDRETKRIVSPKVLPKSKAPSRAKQRLQTGDVLVSMTRPNLNAVALVSSEYDGAIGSTGFHVLRARDALPGYLFYAVQTPDFVDAMCRKVQGALYPAVRPRDIEGYSMGLPDKTDQRRIVAEIEKQFTRLDAGFAALRRAQANLKRYRAAILKAACEGRLVRTEAELARNENRTFESGEQLLQRTLAARRKNWTGRSTYKEPVVQGSDLRPKLPAGWTSATLDALAAIKGGVTKDQKREHSEPARSVPYLRVANVQRGYLDLREVKEIAATQTEIEELKLYTGDILFNEGGDRDKLGRGWIWNNELPECIHQNHVFRARLFVSDINPKFVSWYANTFGQKFFFDEGKHTTNLASISLSKLKALSVPIPPPAEQIRIVAEVERRLSVVDTLEQSLCESEARARRLRESILQSQFGGEDKRKRPEPPPEPTKPPTDAARLVSVDSSPITKPSQRPPATQSDIAVSSDDISGIKLLRFRLFEDFNSLKAFDYTYRRKEVPESVVSPLCFVGLNGSGKSNLLEALSEALCSTELYLLPWKSAGRVRRYRTLRFILEYTLTQKHQKPVVHVRIERIDRRPPRFHIIDGDTASPVTSMEECLRLLPSRILGYSSGLNETISVPYLRTAALYSEEVRNQARQDWKARQKHPPVASSRVLFMDYECNALILVANYLFASAGTLAMFRRALRIDRLASFDLRFRPSFQRTREVALTPELRGYLESFSACADDVHRGVAGIRTFRFLQDGAGIRKLRDRFHTAENFFGAIYQLSLLNALALKGRDRSFYLKRTLKEGQLERPPTVAREDRIFSVENIRLALSRPRRVIDYAAISDGEHQFLQVLGAITLFSKPGSLFVLDEPETHFNPHWRRRLVQLLNQIRTTAGQEFLVSTHSPFVVSGCRGSGVFLFERKGQSSISRPAGFETFGASYDVLLERLFGLKTMIAGQAAEELMTFEEALKFSVAVQSCVQALNRYNRATKAGRDMGLGLCIKFDVKQVTVMESRTETDE